MRQEVLNPRPVHQMPTMGDAEGKSTGRHDRRKAEKRGRRCDPACPVLKDAGLRKTA